MNITLKKLVLLAGLVSLSTSVFAQDYVCRWMASKSNGVVLSEFGPTRSNLQDAKMAAVDACHNTLQRLNASAYRCAPESEIVCAPAG